MFSVFLFTISDPSHPDVILEQQILQCLIHEGTKILSTVLWEAGFCQDSLGYWDQECP